MKNQVWNRIILGCLIIGSTVLVSFYGGTMSWVLFYFSLMIPIVSFLYIIYVLLRFRIYQYIDRKTIVKEEEVPYQFQLSNEDFLSYACVSVSFFQGFSSVGDVLQTPQCYLLPGQSIREESKLVCHYRGEYKVGIAKVTVCDYLNLFKLTWRVPTAIRATVYPRIVDLDHFLPNLLDQEDKKNKTIQGGRNSIPDVEVRQYLPGDDAKKINWKLSARTGELMTRKDVIEPNHGICLMFNHSKKSASQETCLMIEDKMIEAALAIANYCVKQSMPMKFTGTGTNLEIYNKNGLKQFYQYCCGLSFRGQKQLNQWGSCASFGEQQLCIIWITHTLDLDSMKDCFSLVQMGQRIVILYVGDERVKEQVNLLDQRIDFYQIHKKQEVKQVLEQMGV